MKTLLLAAVVVAFVFSADGAAAEPSAIQGKLGSWIAFASATRDIYLVDAEGKNLKRLTHGRTADENPSWSPDGKKIAFVSRRDGNPELYVMNADGDNQRRLTYHSADDALACESPACWSPDGKRLAFCSQRNRNGDIYLINVDGTGLERLTRNRRFDDRPSWSPDGRQIAFQFTRDGAHAWDTYVINTDGSEQKNLTDHPAMDFAPVWSPDGSKIAFTSTTDRDTDSEQSTRCKVYVMNRDGSELRRLTDDSYTDALPCWSPDSKKLAFSSAMDRESAKSRECAICVTNVDGSELKRLTEDCCPESTCCWSRDGKQIAFIGSEKGAGEADRSVYVTSTDGGNQRRLIDMPVAPTGLSWSPILALVSGTK